MNFCDTQKSRSSHMQDLFFENFDVEHISAECEKY